MSGGHGWVCWGVNVNKVKREDQNVIRMCCCCVLTVGVWTEWWSQHASKESLRGCLSLGGVGGVSWGPGWVCWGVNVNKVKWQNQNVIRMCCCCVLTVGV